MNVQRLLKGSEVFLKKNASTILTCVGVAGVVATTVTAIKATPKALQLLEEAKEEKGEELTTAEAIKTAAPVYIPTVLIGASTIACMVGANMLNKKAQASLMSAYALLDNSYKDYKKKVDELYGENADENVRNELAKDNYDSHQIPEGENQLFYDEFSERYFEAPLQRVMMAEYELNKIIATDCGAYLNEWYELLGIDRVDYGDYMGWNSCALVDMYWECWVNFDHRKVVMDDGLECTIISIVNEPIYQFEDY